MTRKGFKECPVCCEKIRAKALVCRFCGAVLTEQHLPSLISPQLAEAVEKERETREAERKTRADVGRGAPEPAARPPKPKEPRPKGLDDLKKTVGKEDLNEIIQAHFSGARVESARASSNVSKSSWSIRETNTARRRSFSWT